MILGIFTRVFQRSSLEQVADAIRLARLSAVQLNLVSAGLASLPSRLDADAARRISDVFRERGLKVAALSATFNSIHPNPAVRVEGIRRFELLASRSELLGTSVLSMCTGSRDSDDMWHGHPGNDSKDAWTDLLETTRALVKIASEHGVTIAFEPETVNVINTAAKAELLLGEIDSPHLRVLFDPANLIRPGDLPDCGAVVRDALARIGEHIVLAHAKDVMPPAPGSGECRRVAPGQGMLDWPAYLQGLAQCGFTGTIAMHDLAEQEIEGCRSMIEGLLAAQGA